MVDLAFRALEYGADTGLRPVDLRFVGSTEQGFEVERNGEAWLRVGAGYRVLRTRACGVCSTDLDRHFLPFRLPQVTGHEMLAVEPDGTRVVVEINAGPRERGLQRDCQDCAAGLWRHCPERLVLGIHDLPGGFGPFVLAPVGAVVPVPDEVEDEVALLVEPFAAALRAVDRTELRDGDRIAVLGPRKLGMLVLAALAARRRERGADWTLIARVRRAELVGTATAMGADEVVVEAACAGVGLDDVVFDTTASPQGFEIALRLARREVHLKSTHGRPSGGLEQATAFVVDELSMQSLGDRRPEPGMTWGWLGAGPVPEGFARAVPAREPNGGCLKGYEVVVVDDLAGADTAIRPQPGVESGLVRPTGTILLREPRGGVLAEAVVRRGIRLASSRCGDFRTALELLSRDAELRATIRTLITGRFPASELDAALDEARQRDAIKVLVEHPDG